MPDLPADLRAVETGLKPRERPTGRDTEESVLGTVGRFADKYLGFGSDRRRSRLLSGIASQWYGLDEHGNPAFGETPGLVYETQALTALPMMLARTAMDAQMKALGLPADNPMYKKVQEAMFRDPEFATQAMEKTQAIRDAVREDMGLEAPRGFAENAQESLGVMLGQLPVPGRAATAAPSKLDRIAQAAEWFTPTVQPRVANYAVGTGVGTTLGTLADGAEQGIPVTLQDPDQPGMYHVRPVYSDDSIGFSGHPDDQAALQILLAERAEREQHADGGKVGTASKAVRKFLRSQERFGDNTRRYLDLISRHMPESSVPTSSAETELLEGYADAPWGWSKGDYDALREIVDTRSFDLPADAPLYRGVAKHSYTYGDKPIELDLSPGSVIDTSSLPFTSASSNRGDAQDFAHLFDADDRNMILNIHRSKPVRTFPLVYSGQSEWLLPRPDAMRVRGAKAKPGETEVDVDYTQFNDGGSVKDYCSGGMATVKSMKAKYAGGGKVNTALKAIKDAIAHLDNNDTASAMRTLSASPDALRDPGIVEAMRKLRHPTTAKQGRKALDTAAAADTEKAKLSTFAKGGKVSAVGDVVKRARMTLAEAKKVVRGHGHTLVKEDGEYIVKKKGERTRIEGDDSHYFTDDIDDAVGTSAAMAKQRGNVKD